MELHRETLKLLAVITMTANHTAIVLLPAGTPLYMLLTCIGYFTAPVMCRLLADGCRYTSDLRKYRLRLFLFALLSQFPYMAALQIRQPNILFSLLLCLFIAEIMDREPESPGRSLRLLFLVVLCSFCDWSCVLPLFMIWLNLCWQIILFGAELSRGYTLVDYREAKERGLTDRSEEELLQFEQD